jgi:5-oxoprolinase (ATP-hydrolysing) subunit A
MSLVDLDLNLGERANEPADLYSLATVASIACGGHAGDTASMARAVSFAMARGATIAAHPSYPDREGFGRVRVEITGDALAASVEQQCAALQKIARKLGFPAAIVKPHGALHDDAASDPEIARAFLDGAARGLGVEAITVIGPPNGALADEARRRGFRYARAGFPDRVYAAVGKLVPRSAAGARITDRAAVVRQAVALASSGVIEMLCMDSDAPDAVLLAGDVREALIQNGYLAGNL